MIFTGPCEAIPLLLRFISNEFCSDPGWDRNYAHGLINHFTTAFLLYTLKDDQAQLPAVLWRGMARRVRFDLHDGLDVVCRGHVDVYPPHGKYQLIIDEIQPKGIGALFVRRKPRVRIEAQMHGGGHERGMRSGTLATHQIVGMGEAFRIAREEMAEENTRILALRNRLYDGLKDMEEVYVNGDLDHRIPGNLNISFNFVEGESLMMALKDMAVSSGSACTSASLEPSYVLRALGREDELAHSSLRFTLGRFTTEEEIDHVLSQVRGQVNRLRDLSPLWDMYKDGVDLKSVKWVAH